MMGEFFRRLFDSDFMPHGHCYLWQPSIVWLHVVSDALIALAYYSIPVFLILFVRRRRGVPFPGLFAMFALFILACGTTHAFEVWTLWHGTYRIAGVIKAVTAFASVGTLVALVPIFPKLLALRTPAEWEAANRLLATEAAERQRAQAAEAELNATLERKVAQLTALNDELEAFSYSVSHDLRAPLRHIDGFTALLRERSESVLDETSRRDLARVGDAAKHMGRLIDDLLRFSRMGRGELQLTDVDLTPLVREVSDELGRDAAPGRVRWTIESLPAVRGDRALLRVAIVNLLSNALKYSSKRSPAEIEVRGRTDEGGMPVILVRDNGVGFDMRYAGKLFGVFQRLHRADEFEGTGIGLATVRRIVHRHGGRIWAESRPDEGATFSFTLPAA